MYKKIFYNFLVLILAVAASISLIPAQARGEMEGGFQDQFRQIKRRQLGPALGVSQQIVDQLLLIEQHYQARRRHLFQASKADFKRLLQVMSQPSPPEPEVTAILKSIKVHQQEKQNLQQMQAREEEKLLSPVQQARNIMYQRKLLREARSVKRKRPGQIAPRDPSAPREILVSQRTGNYSISAGPPPRQKSALIGADKSVGTVSLQRVQLEKALRVNEQTAERLLEVVNRYQPLRQKLIEEAKIEFQRLEQAMGQPSPSNQEVKTFLNNIKKKEQEIQSLKQRQDEDEMAILTPVQQGRYLMFLISLRQQMVKEPQILEIPPQDRMGPKPAVNAPTRRYPAAR